MKKLSFKKILLITKDIDFLVKFPRGPFPDNTENIYNILKYSGYVSRQALLSKTEKYIPDITKDMN